MVLYWDKRSNLQLDMNAINRLLFYFSAAISVLVLSNIPVNAQKDTTKSKQILIFPVATRSIETSWSFGLAGASTFKMSKKDTATRTSNLQTIVLYSLKKQFVAAINGAQYFKNEKYILNEQLSYSSFPDKFWGLGKYSPDSAEEPYTFKQYYVYLHFIY